MNSLSKSQLTTSIKEEVQTSTHQINQNIIGLYWSIKMGRCALYIVQTIHLLKTVKKNNKIVVINEGKIVMTILCRIDWVRVPKPPWYCLCLFIE